jgi:hypothetical protein
VEEAILSALIAFRHAWVACAGSFLHEAAAGTHEGNPGAAGAPGSAKAEAVRASTVISDLIMMNE